MRVRFATILAVLGVTLAALVVGVCIGTRVFAGSERVCRGVVVSGIDLSGMTSADAQASLRDYAKTRSNEVLVLTAGSKRWSGRLGDLGIGLKWQDAAHKAWLIGRSGGLVQRASDLIGLGARGRFDVLVAVNPTILDTILDKAARTVGSPHSNASIRIVAGSFSIKPERDGLTLDKKAAYAAVQQAVRTGVGSVELPVTVDKATVTATDLRSINGLLAEYTTRFKVYQRDRTMNLKIAAKAINGSIVKPGEVLSYNAIVGERAAERGYRNAPIFVKGKVEPGLGGGVCQVSSTLYNAVLLAGLKINERYHHSRVVVYVPAGRDATVAYGSRDLKFTNSLRNPIYIGSSVQGSHLRIAIFGSREDRTGVKVWSSASRYGTAKSAVTIDDPTLKPGKRKVTDKGTRGVSAVVHRSITAGGKTVTEVVSRDIYPAQPKLISVGPRGEAKKSSQASTVAAARAGSPTNAD